MSSPAGYSNTTIFDKFLLPDNFAELKDIVLNMNVEDSDIWICTFPKSGTTWTQEAVWILTNNLDFQTAKEKFIYERTTFVEKCLFFHQFEAKDLHNVKVRMFKTHLPWNFLPKQIQNFTKKPKIIVTTRHPADAMVSFYHHEKNLHAKTWTFQEYFNKFINNEIIYTPFWLHFKSYFDVKDSTNMHFMRYEDMKVNLSGELLKLAKFLDVNVKLDDAALKALNDHLTFKSMKDNNRVNLDAFQRDNFSFVRKGIVGDYKNHFDQDMCDSFNEWMNKFNRAEYSEYISTESV